MTIFDELHNIQIEPADSIVIFLPGGRAFDKVYRIDEAVVGFKSDPMCIHV